jgi:4-amino-4-deoxy-L-arabinose transferase-like glycosyltransferase
MQKRNFNTTPLIILLLALGIRLLGIVSRPIWYDEAFSILFSEKGLDAMLYGTLAPTGMGSADIHPLGYYTTLWIWIKMFGTSLVAARSLSILAGLVSVFLVYRIALQATSDTSTASLSMLIAALAPFQVHYAQEIRMYAFLAMWLLLATYAYQRGVREGNWKWWGLLSISAALAQYSHNLAAFYLIPLALLPVLRKNWRAVQGMALAGLGALILYSPWLVQLPAQVTNIQNIYWVERPDVSKLFTLLLVFITNTPLPTNLIPGAFAIVLVIVAIGFLQTIRHIRQTGTKEGLLLLYLSFAPPLLLFLFSQWTPVYIERALLPSGAIFCIWLAWVVRNTNLAISPRYALLFLFGLSSLLGIYQHVMYSDFPYGPFKELDAALRQRLEAQDVIVHANKRTMLPAILFGPGLPHAFIGDPPGSAADTLAPATQQVLSIQAYDIIQSATGSAPRVWYIIHQRKIDEYTAGGHATHPDIAYLDSQYILVSEESWDELRVFLYTKKP